MLDESLRRRLEALNREPLPATAGCTGSDVTGTPLKRLMELPRRAVGGKNHRTATAVLRPAGKLLDIGEVVETPVGAHLRIIHSVDAIWKEGERLVSARHRILTQSPTDNGQASSSPEPYLAHCSYRTEVQALIESFPERTLYLDLETCGLAGAALFLVGLLRRVDGRLIVELLLARNYAEEKAVLVSLWERAAMHDVLVTFNGKSFDWPMVHDRSTRYLLGVRGAPLQHRSGPAELTSNGSEADATPLKRIATNADANPLKRVTTSVLGRRDLRPELVHVDILHHARRRWRGRLPNCKLQTLERYICGRRRDGDIPGARIPAAYQRFVETGDTREIESILFHNALDLVTLLDLSMRLADA